ncbi:MAG: RluA family pseudouridine synthase [Firmicutes bacterium]|nr:RluA family pseudouridine synthase [Bacillota bacterium]
MEIHFTYLVLPGEDGYPLKRILKEKLSLSEGLIRRAKFVPGAIRVNGLTFLRDRPVTTRFSVQPGDQVEITIPDREPAVIPAQGELDILFENENLLVLNKPAGLAVHPAKGHFNDTLVNYLAYAYPEPPRLIGRLDKDTSGALLAARTALSADRLKQDRERGDVTRIYLALVLGQLPPQGRIDAPLKETREGTPPGDNGHPLRLMKAEEDGMEAHTLFQTLDYTDGISLVKIKLLTGRTHQIRAHFASFGHPLLGDHLYQAFCGITEKDITASRAMLHSYQLTFPDPLSGKILTVQAPLPDDFKAHYF